MAAREWLSLASAMADRDDVTTLGNANLFHGHCYSQDNGLEGQREVLLDRRVNPT